MMIDGLTGKNTCLQRGFFYGERAGDLGSSAAVDDSVVLDEISDNTESVV